MHSSQHCRAIPLSYEDHHYSAYVRRPLSCRMQVDEDEHNLMSREELESEDCNADLTAVWQRIWCSIPITTGASNDIGKSREATKVARAMITRPWYERGIWYGCI